MTPAFQIGSHFEARACDSLVSLISLGTEVGLRSLIPPGSLVNPRAKMSPVRRRCSVAVACIWRCALVYACDNSVYVFFHVYAAVPILVQCSYLLQAGDQKENNG